jgi:hypothetical protein
MFATMVFVGMIFVRKALMKITGGITFAKWLLLK